MMEKLSVMAISLSNGCRLYAYGGRRCFGRTGGNLRSALPGGSLVEQVGAMALEPVHEVRPGNAYVLALGRQRRLVRGGDHFAALQQEANHCGVRGSQFDVNALHVAVHVAADLLPGGVIDVDLLLLVVNAK